MKAIELFAGAGLLSLALREAGFDVLSVERDRRACETHNHNLGAGSCIRTEVVGWHPPRSADLVAGGPPCQPFSSQGKRQGTEERRHLGSLFGPDFERRGELYKELARVAVEANARGILMENVSGLATWNEGAAIAAVEASFRDAGFVHIYRRILDAVDYGVPQHRKRLFIVAFRENVPFSWPAVRFGPHATVGVALGLTGSYVSGFRKEGFWQGGRAIDVNAPSWTIGTRGTTLTSCVRSTVQLRRLQRGLMRRECQRRASKYPLGVLAESLNGAGLLNRPATTLSASKSGGRLARPGHKGHGDQWNGSVRLTKEQCAILQDFPDGWRFAGTDDEVHRQIGNAVPLRLGHAVATSVFEALTGGLR